MTTKITAAEIQADTHVWIGDEFVFVASVRTNSLGFVVLNGGERILAGDRLVMVA